MDPIILLDIAILLLLAKILGEICEKFNLSSVLGEVAAGIILGPFILGLIFPDALGAFALLGVVLLLFVAGFEAVDIRRIIEHKKTFLYVGVTGFIITISAQIYIGLRFFNATFYQSLFYALAVGTTDVAVFTRTLISLGKVKDKLSHVAYSTSVADNLLAFILLGVGLTLVSTSGHAADFGFLAFKIGAIALVFIIFALIAKKFLVEIAFLRVEEAEFTFIFAMVLLLAYITEILGASAVLGALFAGIILGSSRFLESTSFTKKLSSISYGIFIPIFFAWAGLQMNFANIGQLIVPAIQIFFIAIAIRLAVPFVTSRFYGLSWQQSLGMSLCDFSRGGEQLLLVILARTVGVFNNPFGDAVFLAVVLLIIITTFLQPILLRYYYKNIAK